MIINNVISEARDIAVCDNKYFFSEGYQSNERVEKSYLFFCMVTACFLGGSSYIKVCITVPTPFKN